MMMRLKNLLLSFASVFFISGVTFFIAYNWKGMGNMEKLSIPLSLVGAGVGGWFFLEKQERYRKISLFFASFFVGTLFALYGQIYQTGADAYQLFLLWGLFILMFSYAERSPSIWTLNAGVLALGGGLFARLALEEVYILYLPALVLYLFFLIYSFALKKRGFSLENWFFYLLPTGATILMNIGVGYSIFRNRLSHILVYLVFLFSLFFLGEKVMKKQGLNVLGIISGTVALSNLSYRYLSGSREKVILHILLTISLFLWVMRVIRKKYISTQSQNLILNIFKVNLIFYLLALVTLLISILGLGDIALLLAGIVLLGIAAYLPLKLKFREDRSEIVTLITGILCIVFYLLQILKLGRIPSFLAGMGIYGFFWYFRHCRALDFLLIPAFTGGLLFIARDLGIRNLTPIIALPLFPILFSMVKSWKGIPRIKRGVRGCEVALMLLGTIFYYDVFSRKIHGEILSLGTVLLSLLILWKIMREESPIKYLFLALLLGGTGYIFAPVWGINLAIMLILLYLQRGEKFMFGVSLTFLAGQIGFYYYRMDKTLLDKSYVMFKNSFLLFAGWLILGRKK